MAASSDLFAVCLLADDSKLLITGSADQTVKLWALETGECLHTFPFETPARYCCNYHRVWASMHAIERTDSNNVRCVVTAGA